MRRPVAVFCLPLALAACTSSPLDGMNRLGTTSRTEPFPANYRALVQHQYGLDRPRDLEVSYPRPLLGEDVFALARWYVCVRAPAGRETIHIIANGRLAGRVAIPRNPEAADICDGGSYGPLG